MEAVLSFRRVFLGLALVCLGILPARGLDAGKRITQYARRAWSSDDGLPQGSVQALHQTRDGYLWIGAQEALARFDGVRFTVFDRRNTAALRIPDVTALAEDASGTLWIGTHGGGLAYLRDGRFG
jgi:ligand-binding sensor domain-containing protein